MEEESCNLFVLRLFSIELCTVLFVCLGFFKAAAAACEEIRVE